MKGCIHAIVGLLMLTGCANHPIDCAVGFYHRDCLPGTAGYDDPAKFAEADDKQCKSYGLEFGTQPYATCRMELTAQHQGQEPNIGFGVVGVTRIGR
jgi:hypothetical protein